MSAKAGPSATGAFAAVAFVLALTLFLTLEGSEWIPILILGTWLLTTAGVGALVMANRPDNSVGPLMVAASLGVALGLLVEAYASYIYELGHPDLPLGMTAAWMSLWLTIPAFSLFMHLFLRFPSGRLPSPGWRWVSRLLTAGVVLSCVGYGLRPGRIDGVPQLANPLGDLVAGGLAEALLWVGETSLTAGGFLSIVSLVVRFRRASVTERQRMKWFVLAVAAFPVLALIGQWVQAFDDSKDEYAGFLVIAVALLLVPVSMGIGILRHRLYDIDVVVNRALVYGALTAILAAAYLGIVVLLQGLLRPITAESDLAVAGSTLVVAGLFRPIRERVQAFIDRRFYRRKYDASETLGAFAARLRDQVDLDSLRNELVGAVSTTMQPTHASLWLRQEGRR